MKQLSLLLLVVGLAACGQSETPTPQQDVPTVEELAAAPGRLKELRQQCQTDPDTLDEVLCSRVTEATRKRFYGDGKVPYTPSDTPPAF